MKKWQKYELDCSKDELIMQIKNEAINHKSPYIGFYFKYKDGNFTLIPIFKLSMNVFYSKPIPLYIYPVFIGQIIGEGKKTLINVRTKWSTSLRVVTSITLLALLLNLIGGGLSGLIKTLTGEGAFVLPVFFLIIYAIYQMKKKSTKIFIEKIINNKCSI